jgi:acetyltransferase-like isoleucine patch superfamily enzyme
MRKPARRQPGDGRSLGKLLHAVRKRALKGIAKGFPLNEVRVRALRAAGYALGHDVYVGPEFHVADDLFSDVCRLTIGERVAISPRVLVVLFSHPNSSRVGKHVAPVQGAVTIDDDAWIGAGAILLPNIRIGEQAVVGAGAVVTKDVRPRTVVAGNPARFLRMIDDGERLAEPDAQHAIQSLAVPTGST